MIKDQIRICKQAAIHFGMVALIWLVCSFTAILFVPKQPAWLLLLLVLGPFILFVVSSILCTTWIIRLSRYRTGWVLNNDPLVRPFWMKNND